MSDPAIGAEIGPIAERDGERDALLNPGFTALLVAQGSFGFAFSSFFLLPKYMDTALGAGPFEIGLLTAVYGAVVIVCVPWMGSLVDRRGRRDYLTGGALLMTAASLAFVFVDRVGPLLYALRAVQGLAFSMAFAAGAALAVDLASPRRLSQAIGIFGLAFLSMNAIAPAAVEEISERASWPTAFAAAAGGALLCALLSRRIPEPPLSQPTGAMPSLWDVARRPRLLRLMAVVALMGVAMGALFTYHQPFAIALGVENVKGFFIAYAATAVFVRAVLGGFADRLGRHRVALVSLALYVPLVTAMSKLQPGWLPWFGAGLGIAHGFAYPTLNALAVEGVGEAERGKVMSLFQAAFNVGFAGLSFGLGWVAETQGYPAVFLVGGLCALAALVLLANSPESRSGG